jgi:hypothetical protein
MLHEWQHRLLQHAASTGAAVVTLHPTFICTSFFHTAFGRGGSSKIGATGYITLRHVSCASVLSGCSPTVAEQQSSSGLMACCHKATALPDMPAAADHQLHVKDVQCMSSHGHGDMDQPGTSSAPAALLSVRSPSCTDSATPHCLYRLSDQESCSQPQRQRN